MTTKVYHIMIILAQSGMVSINFQIESNPQNHDRIFVLQKYLENPLLYNGRKFDFRVWVMMDHFQNLYFFREGYLRLSCEQFDLQP
jgi:tubulin--tyrosine ligase/tubulin polyglutamylase TTLL9